MGYDYDVLVIGLGPAGMVLSNMATTMGLRTAAIERKWIGGECQNVGCIPSKALLRMAKTRHTVTRFPRMELDETAAPGVRRPFDRIRSDIDHIRDEKTTGMFEKVDLIIGEGDAEFIDLHTVAVGDRRISAKRIFICVGTRPARPPIPGLDDIDVLTNENIFDLGEIPRSMTIIGGGAIGCEMAQAFARLGCKCTIVHMDSHLIPPGDPEAGALLEKAFRDEHIDVFNARTITRLEQEGERIALHTSEGERIVSDRLLLGAGRRVDLDALRLDRVGIRTNNRGIVVDKYLRTNHKHIYACGDCNGHFLLTHAAMHQGMIALMNAMLPFPLRQNFRKFVVPWTVFTEPMISHVGMREEELREKNISYETIVARYDDYGAAIAEGADVGFVKVFTSKLGRIHGVSIVGEGSGEMINEWALAIQSGIRLHKIMLLQHSFPTMGFLTMRSASLWMTGRMKSPALRRWAKRFYSMGR